ncbi:unnamed protein product [Calypogeia fissa]
MHCGKLCIRVDIGSVVVMSRVRSRGTLLAASRDGSNHFFGLYGRAERAPFAMQQADHQTAHGPAFHDKRAKPKDDLKMQRERLRNCLIIEERKAMGIVKLKREREKQERRELYSQQLELSDLHSSRRCLHHYGWIPWKKMMLSSRLLEERALLHSAISLLRRTLLAWKTLMSSPERELLMYKKLLHLRAALFRKKWQQKICWIAWLLLHKAEKQYQQALLGLCFSTLKEALASARIADEHAQRSALWCCLQSFPPSEVGVLLQLVIFVAWHT